MNYLKIASTLVLSTYVAMGAPKKMLFVSLILSIITVVLDKNRFMYIKERTFYDMTVLNILVLIGGLSIYSKYISNDNGYRFIVKYFDVLLPLVIVWVFIGRFSEFIKYSLIGLGIGNIINSMYAINNWLKMSGRVGGYFGGPNDLGGILLVLTPFFCMGCMNIEKQF